MPCRHLGSCWLYTWRRIGSKFEAGECEAVPFPVRVRADVISRIFGPSVIYLWGAGTDVWGLGCRVLGQMYGVFAVGFRVKGFLVI